MQYPALFTPAEEGGFVVTFPDLEGAVTQGDNELDAREMARDAVITMLAHWIRQGAPIPLSSHPRGRHCRMIELPAMVAAKTQLYLAFRASGLTKTALAQKLRIPKTTVDRLFDFRNHSRLDQLEAAFTALGKRISVEVRDAA